MSYKIFLIDLRAKGGVVRGGSRKGRGVVRGGLGRRGGRKGNGQEGERSTVVKETSIFRVFWTQRKNDFTTDDALLQFLSSILNPIIWLRVNGYVHLCSAASFAWLFQEQLMSNKQQQMLQRCKDEHIHCQTREKHCKTLSVIISQLPAVLHYGKNIN